jgi:hypothetical protein
MQLFFLSLSWFLPSFSFSIIFPFVPIQTHFYFDECVIGLDHGCTNFQTNRNHLKILGARRVACTVGSRFATVHFTVRFYDPCRVGPSTPALRCITVATQRSFLYLVRF